MTGQDRALLRKASVLLQQAGYLIRDAQRVSPQDEPFIVEFLIDDPISLPHHNVFIKNLGLLGIEVNAKPLVWKFSNDFKHSH